MFLRRKGQNTMEYAILVGVIAIALLVMRSYIKRGVQGKFKEATDSVGQQFSLGSTDQSSQTIVRSQSTERVTLRDTTGLGVAAGNVTTGVLDNDLVSYSNTTSFQDQKRSEASKTGNATMEKWGE